MPQDSPSEFGVKRMVRSEGYARARLVNGVLFTVMGSIVLYRTIATTGFAATAIPGCVLGAAMIALGVFRWRAYRVARRA